MKEQKDDGKIQISLCWRKDMFQKNHNRMKSMIVKAQVDDDIRITRLEIEPNGQEI